MFFLNKPIYYPIGNTSVVVFETGLRTIFFLVLSRSRHALVLSWSRLGLNPSKSWSCLGLDLV